MKTPSKRIALISAGAALILAATAWSLTRPPRVETCFDRLGGPGPNSNTSRLSTALDIPVGEWPAVAQIFRDFAAEHHWSLQEGVGSTHPDYRWLDMCDDAVTIVRASNADFVQVRGQNRIGFGIIHMTYEGPGNNAWQPVYRDLHRRLEARWPGRMVYVEGEFGRTIARPDWLGPVPPHAQHGEGTHAP